MTTMNVVTADVGGSKTTIRINEGEREIARGQGPGAAVRPGRALATAAAVADLIRQTMASCGIIRAGTIVVGAAGAGNAADADEIRLALVRERIADRVVVTTDVALALEAAAEGPAAVLLAGTGSIAFGRNEAGTVIRQGGLGWRMGDEGSGYWIGHSALKAVGLAHDGRADETVLSEALLTAARVGSVRELAAWAAVAEPPEIAGLVPAVVKAAAGSDACAAAILASAADELVGLVKALSRSFERPAEASLSVTGGLVQTDGPIRKRLIDSLSAGPFSFRPDPLDPLLGGPRLAAKAPA
jgi:N-acetylglucosamine kinase-like BadF-type ATPase